MNVFDENPGVLQVAHTGGKINLQSPLIMDRVRKLRVVR